MSEQFILPKSAGGQPSYVEKHKDANNLFHPTIWWSSKDKHVGDIYVDPVEPDRG